MTSQGIPLIDPLSPSATLNITADEAISQQGKECSSHSSLLLSIPPYLTVSHLYHSLIPLIPRSFYSSSQHMAILMRLVGYMVESRKESSRTAHWTSYTARRLPQLPRPSHHLFVLILIATGVLCVVGGLFTRFYALPSIEVFKVLLSHPSAPLFYSTFTLLLLYFYSTFTLLLLYFYSTSILI